MELEPKKPKLEEVVESNNWPWQSRDRAHTGIVGPENDEKYINSEQSISRSFSPVDVLILVVNDVEFNVAYKLLRPLEKKGHKITCHTAPNGMRMYSGKMSHPTNDLQSMTVALVRSGQDSLGSTASQKFTTEAVLLYKPKLVCLAGVAFGTPAFLIPGDDNKKNNKELRLGDVLVSSQIISYDQQRGCDDSSTLRSQLYVFPQHLCHELNQLAKDWSSNNQARKAILYEPNGRKNSVAFMGSLLSGNVPVESTDFHKTLVQEAKQKGCVPIGGEMKGTGVTGSMSWVQSIPVVIIKGIGDWGIEKASTDFELVAARASFHFIRSVLPKLFESLPPPQNPRSSSKMTIDSLPALPLDASSMKEMLEAAKQFAEKLGLNEEAYKAFWAKSQTFNDSDENEDIKDGIRKINDKIAKISDSITQLTEQRQNLEQQLDERRRKFLENDMKKKIDAEKNFKNASVNLQRVWKSNEGIGNKITFDNTIITRKSSFSFNPTLSLLRQFILPATEDRMREIQRKERERFSYDVKNNNS